MSKSVVRIALPVLISLVVILAIFTTVQGASFSGVADKVGAHSVSGVLTNFNHDRLTFNEQQAVQSELESLDKSSTGRGHGCEDEAFNSPLD